MQDLFVSILMSVRDQKKIQFPKDRRSRSSLERQRQTRIHIRLLGTDKTVSLGKPEVTESDTLGSSIIKLFFLPEKN